MLQKEAWNLANEKAEKLRSNLGFKKHGRISSQTLANNQLRCSSSNPSLEDVTDSDSNGNNKKQNKI